MQSKRRDLHPKWPHREANDNTLLLLYFTTMNTKHNYINESHMNGVYTIQLRWRRRTFVTSFTQSCLMVAINFHFYFAYFCSQTTASCLEYLWCNEPWRHGALPLSVHSVTCISRQKYAGVFTFLCHSKLTKHIWTKHIDILQNIDPLVGLVSTPGALGNPCWRSLVLPTVLIRLNVPANGALYCYKTWLLLF